MKWNIRRLLPWLLCLLFDVIALVGVWLWGYHCGKESGKEGAATDTKVEVRHEVARKANPSPAKTRSIGCVTVPVEVKSVEPEEPTDIPDGRIIVFKPHSLADTAHRLPPDSTKDSLRAIIPITQKEYRDSDFTAYVSGFHVSLDSIEVRRTIVTTTRAVAKFRRWNFGLTGGYGYGFNSKRLEPFVGFGITVHLLP